MAHRINCTLEKEKKLKEKRPKKKTGGFLHLTKSNFSNRLFIYSLLRLRSCPIHFTQILKKSSNPDFSFHLPPLPHPSTLIQSLSHSLALPSSNQPPYIVSFLSHTLPVPGPSGLRTHSPQPLQGKKKEEKTITTSALLNIHFFYINHCLIQSQYQTRNFQFLLRFFCFFSLYLFLSIFLPFLPPFLPHFFSYFFANSIRTPPFATPSFRTPYVIAVPLFLSLHFSLLSHHLSSISLVFITACAVCPTHQNTAHSHSYIILFFFHTLSRSRSRSFSLTLSLSISLTPISIFHTVSIFALCVTERFLFSFNRFRFFFLETCVFSHTCNL